MAVYPQQFPACRPRRLRQSSWVRKLVQETTLLPQHLIWPVFVCADDTDVLDIPTLPGIRRQRLQDLPALAGEAVQLGIPLLALFPVIPTAFKNDDGTEATNPDNLLCQAIQILKAANPNVGIMCDVALDLYTSHGHDGVMRGDQIDNDVTVEILVQQALTLARAGCDILGPSDMMDGRVQAIRTALEANDFKQIQIFSYGAKYASALYGPYRDAVGSTANLNAGKTGPSKATYQQDPANSEEALKEVAMDVAEGADAIIVKPATYYMDIIHRVRNTFQVPVIGYHVSGEYAMIQAASQAGMIDGESVLFEAVLSLRRAGCQAIITYGAPALAQICKTL